MRLLRVVALVVGFSSAGFAQTGTSVITGTVMDSSGGAIPSVDVTLTNQETGTNQQALTNDTGSYRFTALPPGTYRIEAQLVGFERLSRGPITLQVSQTLAMDLALQVGQIGQTVDVTEAAPLIDSQTSDVSQAVTRQMIAAFRCRIALPLRSRHWRREL